MRLARLGALALVALSISACGIFPWHQYGTIALSSVSISRPGQRPEVYDEKSVPLDVKGTMIRVDFSSQDDLYKIARDRNYFGTIVSVSECHNNALDDRHKLAEWPDFFPNGPDTTKGTDASRETKFGDSGSLHGYHFFFDPRWIKHEPITPGSLNIEYDLTQAATDICFKLSMSGAPFGGEYQTNVIRIPKAELLQAFGNYKLSCLPIGIVCYEAEQGFHLHRIVPLGESTSVAVEVSDDEAVSRSVPLREQLDRIAVWRGNLNSQQSPTRLYDVKTQHADVAAYPSEPDIQKFCSSNHATIALFLSGIETAVPRYAYSQGVFTDRGAARALSCSDASTIWSGRILMVVAFRDDMPMDRLNTLFVDEIAQQLSLAQRKN